MSLLNSLNDELKAAMRTKDSLKLEALRAIKSAVLLAKTATARDTDLSEEEEIKLLQKLVKQRKDSAGIFRQQNRDDLAAPEEDQAYVIAQFLPKQLSPDVIEKIIDQCPLVKAVSFCVMRMFFLRIIYLMRFRMKSFYPLVMITFHG